MCRLIIIVGVLWLPALPRLLVFALRLLLDILIIQDPLLVCLILPLLALLCIDYQAVLL